MKPSQFEESHTLPLWIGILTHATIGNWTHSGRGLRSRCLMRRCSGSVPTACVDGMVFSHSWTPVTRLRARQRLVLVPPRRCRRAVGTQAFQRHRRRLRAQARFRIASAQTTQFLYQRPSSGLCRWHRAAAVAGRVRSVDVEQQPNHRQEQGSKQSTHRFVREPRLKSCFTGASLSGKEYSKQRALHQRILVNVKMSSPTKNHDASKKIPQACSSCSPTKRPIQGGP